MGGPAGTPQPPVMEGLYGRVLKAGVSKEGASMEDLEGSGPMVFPEASAEGISKGCFLVGLDERDFQGAALQTSFDRPRHIAVISQGSSGKLWPPILVHTSGASFKQFCQVASPCCSFQNEI